MAKKKEKFHYRESTEAELEKELRTVIQELFKLRFRGSTSPLKNPMEIRRLRREVARLNTFLNLRTVLRNGPVDNSNHRNGRTKA